MVDFKKNPELRNSEIDFYYFQSPHKQIFEDFKATIIKVSDGDTVRVVTEFRDFDFPIRLLDIDAQELKASGGPEAQNFLENFILGKEVDVIMDRNRRVDKWGRLLGKINFHGLDIGENMIRNGHATTFDARRESLVPQLNEIVPEI